MTLGDYTGMDVGETREFKKGKVWVKRLSWTQWQTSGGKAEGLYESYLRKENTSDPKHNIDRTSTRV